MPVKQNRMHQMINGATTSIWELVTPDTLDEILTDTYFAPMTSFMERFDWIRLTCNAMDHPHHCLLIVEGVGAGRVKVRMGADFGMGQVSNAPRDGGLELTVDGDFAKPIGPEGFKTLAGLTSEESGLDTVSRHLQDAAISKDVNAMDSAWKQFMKLSPDLRRTLADNFRGAE